MSLDDLFDVLDCYIEESNYYFFNNHWKKDDFKPLTNIIYDGNISTIAEPRGIQLTAGH